MFWEAYPALVLILISGVISASDSGVTSRCRPIDYYEYRAVQRDDGKQIC